jgi:hypothetical protein
MEMKPASDTEKAVWFAEFEKTGAYEVRGQVYSDRRKTAAAKEWLSKKDAAAERRSKWALWVAVATLSVALATLIVTSLAATP